MPFLLLGEHGEFAGYHVATVSQPEGRNFEADPLDIELPPGCERLKQAYGFTAAIHSAYDSYARNMFGGHLPDGAGIDMHSNLLIQTTEVPFDLPEDRPDGGW